MTLSVPVLRCLHTAEQRWQATLPARLSSRIARAVQRLSNDKFVSSCCFSSPFRVSPRSSGGCAGSRGGCTGSLRQAPRSSGGCAGSRGRSTGSLRQAPQWSGGNTGPRGGCTGSLRQAPRWLGGSAGSSLSESLCEGAIPSTKQR